MKNNRLISFLIILIVYTIATIIGVVTYNALDITFWLKVLIADVVATIVVFIFSLIFKNASVYDPYWSVAPIIILSLLMIEFGTSVSGLLALIAVVLWGVRLTINWAYTFENLNHEDWRYRMLNKKCGKFYPIINFIGIHMVPTLVVYFAIIPLALVIKEKPSINIFVVIFFVLCILSMILQMVSDIEMHKFRKNKNAVFNRNGLWKYSRHPNYLAEILMWWNAGLLAVSAFNGMLGLLFGAFLNTLLFLFVSIPLAEGHQKERKEGFDLYKSETRMLLPIKKPLF
jgi:steroid 5-alpha reductase family enzyme